MGFLWYLQTALPDLLHGLRARGHEVTVIKSYPRDRRMPEERLPDITYSLIELYARRLAKSRVMEVAVFAEFIVRCILHGVRSRPDVVIAVDVDTLLPGYVIARLCRAKLVFYSLELYTERPGVRGRRFWLWLEKALVNKADLVVTCEPNRARVMLEQYGARRLPMVVLNVPRYAPAERGNHLQEYLNGKGVTARGIALYQGGIGRARCINEIVEAATMLAEGHVIVIVGRIEEGYDLDGVIRSFGVEDKVHYYGCVPTIEDLRSLTGSADLGLQLQFNTGLNAYYCAPGKLFQYLAAGLPVVASNFPGMIEIVEGEEVGLCVDPESPRAIAAAINMILDDDALRRRMSATALRVAKEKYCFEVEGNKLLDAIDALPAP
jgi:glycosyltransferase involved in cell wall biosynthesis